MAVSTREKSKLFVYFVFRSFFISFSLTLQLKYIRVRMMVSVTRVDVLQPSAQPSDDLKEKEERKERNKEMDV